MRLYKLLLLFALFALLTGCNNTSSKDEIEIPLTLHFENANSRNTYFTVHNIREAWRYSKGTGVKVGILDAFFGFDDSPGLYAGGLSFQKGQYKQGFYSMTGHGFWMASTLHEIAPEVEIYALGVFSDNEDDQVQSMIKAIDWAIENGLDILTYSSARISEENRILLNQATDRAYEEEIITTFLNYPHPKNILPSQIGPPINGIDNNPKFNIYKYDYSSLNPYDYVKYLGNWKTNIQKPFLSNSSKSPVLAGFIGMIKSVNPDLRSEEIIDLLVDTSYTFETEDTAILKSVDVGAAVRRVVDK